MSTIKKFFDSVRFWICLVFLGFAILIAPKTMKTHILNVMEIYKQILDQLTAEMEYLKPKKDHLKIVGEDDEEE